MEGDFLVDGDLRLSFEELIEKLRQKKSVKKFLKAESFVDFFVEFIACLVSSKDVILADKDKNLPSFKEWKIAENGGF